MAKRRVQFYFAPELVTEPIIYRLGKRFDVITNIRRADVHDDQGWVMLEIEGADDELDRALEWVTAQGVVVEPLGGNVLES